MTTRSNQLLRVVHRSPGVTRAAASRLLTMGTGATTELVARLSQASLLAEAPAAPSGARGRPTTVLVPHPAGPLVLAAEITHETWRVDVTELGGATLASLTGIHNRAPWPDVVAAVTAAISELEARYPGRLRALGVAVPGTVSRTLRLTATNVGWRDVDLTALWAPQAVENIAAPEASGPFIVARAAGQPASAQGSGQPAAVRAASQTASAQGSGQPTTARAAGQPVFVVGNDASFAAAAESARGAATGARVALHLLILGGLGGAVVDQGRLVIGALGAAGEFGHMPFGDPTITCPCGAHGCWGTAVDGTALARLLGHEEPRDPVAYARRIIASPGRAERTAVQAAATALGRGIAGLVNGLDPDLITLGAIAADLLAAAEDDLLTAYRAGLMTIHRADPPPILQAALGADGPIAGAAEEAWASLIPTLA
jgi:predicted NBD/HSP70 family sugar kinase